MTKALVPDEEKPAPKHKAATTMALSRYYDSWNALIKYSAVFAPTYLDTITPLISQLVVFSSPHSPNT